jgi:hypothetical protein
MLTLDWSGPEVHSTLRLEASLRETVLPHPVGAHQDWTNRRAAWRESNGLDWTVWGDYASLIKSHRYGLHIPRRGPGQDAFGFSETFTGLHFERLGFRCFRTVRLFREAPFDTETTREVTKRFKAGRHRWPQLFAEGLDFKPKNPDLVMYSAKRREWRFVETKRDEKVFPEQVASLVFLHLLLGAPVAIVRVVPESNRTREPRVHHCRFRYTGALSDLRALSDQRNARIEVEAS